MEIRYEVDNYKCLTSYPHKMGSEEYPIKVNSTACERCTHFGGKVKDGIITCNHPEEEKKEENKPEFEIGDVVRLNGQDVVMTIILLYANKEEVDVVWLDRNGILQRECLPIEALYKVGE